MRDITDGTANTYLAGEKYLNPDCYITGKDPGDDCTMYQGAGGDIMRWTAYLSSSGAAVPPDAQRQDLIPPQQDQAGFAASQIFGSAHATGCNFVFCDGSVHLINYSIDPEVHRCLGNRKDGTTIDGKKF